MLVHFPEHLYFTYLTDCMFTIYARIYKFTIYNLFSRFVTRFLWCLVRPTEPVHVAVAAAARVAATLLPAARPPAPWRPILHHRQAATAAAAIAAVVVVTAAAAVVMAVPIVVILTMAAAVAAAIAVAPTVWAAWAPAL